MRHKAALQGSHVPRVWESKHNHVYMSGDMKLWWQTRVGDASHPYHATVHGLPTNPLSGWDRGQISSVSMHNNSHLLSWTFRRNQRKIKFLTFSKPWVLITNLIWWRLKRRFNGYNGFAHSLMDLNFSGRSSSESTRSSTGKWKAKFLYGRGERRTMVMKKSGSNSAGHSNKRKQAAQAQPSKSTSSVITSAIVLIVTLCK